MVDGKRRTRLNSDELIRENTRISLSRHVITGEKPVGQLYIQIFVSILQRKGLTHDSGANYWLFFFFD